MISGQGDFQTRNGRIRPLFVSSRMLQCEQVFPAAAREEWVIFSDCEPFQRQGESAGVSGMADTRRKTE